MTTLHVGDPFTEYCFVLTLGRILGTWDRGWNVLINSKNYSTVFYSYFEPIPSYFVDRAVASLWIRDLSEEGIEPHPGPGIISQNIDGLVARLDFFLRSLTSTHRPAPILAALIQEHHLTAKRAHELKVTQKADKQVFSLF